MIDTDKLMNVLKGILWGVIACALMSLLVGCRTKYIEVPSSHTEYVTRTDTLRMVTRDSILVRDSVYVSRWTEGDTVYVTKDRWSVRERLLRDTLYKVRTDTVMRADTITVIKPTTSNVSKSQKRLEDIGRYAFAAVITSVAWLAVWWYRRKI